MAVGCIFTNINIHIEWLYNIYMYRYTNTYIDQLSILKHTTVVCIYIYICMNKCIYIYISPCMYTYCSDRIVTFVPQGVS